MFPYNRTFALLLVWILLQQGCSNSQQGAGGFSMPPMPVETIKVKPQTVYDRFEAVGTIEAAKAITVVSEIDASILSIPFREGGPIQKGALIAQLDTSQLAAEMHRVEALVAQSKASYERIKTVVELSAGSAQDMDDAAAALKVAKSNLLLAQARYSKTRVLAPFSGIIGARRISPGAFVRSGQAITDLAQIDELRVNFSAPERYLSKLKMGAQVSVSTTAYPGYNISGKIEIIEPVLNPATRSARFVALVSNPGQKFRPGMSANINAILSERPNALTIPNEAVFVTGDQTFVFIVNNDSTVSKTALTLGTRLSDVVEVVQGLNPGATVVRAGHQKLYEGARVLPVIANTDQNNSKALEKSK